MAKLLTNMENIFRENGKPVKQQMRHGKGDSNAAETANQLAEIPMAVPELPVQVVGRPEILAKVTNHLLNFAPKSPTTSIKKTEIAAHGEGGIGEYYCVQAPLKSTLYEMSLLFFLRANDRENDGEWR